MRGWTILMGAMPVGVILGGQVTKKLREAGHVLLRVQVDHTLVLATFTKNVPEVDLLVQEGDTVALGLSHSRPFVEDPVIEAVQHPTVTATGMPPAQGR